MPDESADLARILRFKAGDAAAFEEIVEAHQGRIATLCRYLLGNAADAEDATQDVFIKALQGVAGVPAGSGPVHVALSDRGERLHRPQEKTLLPLAVSRGRRRR